MSKPISKRDEVLLYAIRSSKQGKRISVDDAQKATGAYHLPTMVSEFRKAGIVFKQDRKTKKDRYGRTASYCVYWLEDEGIRSAERFLLNRGVTTDLNSLNL